MSSSPKQKGGAWLRGSVGGVLSWLAPVMLSLCVTPTIVKGLGPEQYGLYALILGLIGYSFNLNVSRAATRYVAEALAVGDIGRVRTLVGTSLILALGLGVIGTGSILLLSPWYVGQSVGDASASLQLQFGMLLGGLTVSVLLVGQVFTAVLHGHQRLGWFSATSTATSIVTLVVSLLLVVGGHGFVAVLAGSLCVLAVFTVVNGSLALSLLGWRLPVIFERKCASLIFGHSKYVIGYQLLGNLILLIERTLIARDLGTDALTHYVVPMMIGLNFAGFVNGFSLFVFPAVSEARGSIGVPYRIYRAVTKAVFVACAIALLSTWIHAEAFLTLWIDAEFARLATHAFVIQMIGLTAVALSSVGFQVAEGLGLARINFVATLIVTAVTGILMVQHLTGPGIEGFAVARAMGFCLWLLAIPIIERLAFGAVQTDLWKEVLSKSWFALTLFFLLQSYGPSVLGSGWVGLAATTGAGVLAAGAVLHRTGYFQDLIDVFRGSNDGDEVGSTDRLHS